MVGPCVISLFYLFTPMLTYCGDSTKLFAEKIILKVSYKQNDDDDSTLKYLDLTPIYILSLMLVIFATHCK